MKNGKLIILSISACLVSPAFAADTRGLESDLNVYNQSLIDEGTGTYKRGERIFFIADQPCMKKKLYAGTAESKAATAKAMGLMAEYFLTGKGEVARKMINIPGTLGDDIYQLHKQNKITNINSVSATGRKIIDGNKGGCTGRVVYSLSVKASSQISQKLESQPDINALKLTLFGRALAEQNYARLAAYFASLELPELELAFAAQAIDQKSLRYPAKINWHRDGGSLVEAMTACRLSGAESLNTATEKAYQMTQAAFCGIPVDLAGSGIEYADQVDNTTGQFSQALTDGDKHGLVQLVLQQQGFVLFATAENSARVDVLNKQAQQLFNKGTNAPEIVRLYSQSLNDNPLQPEIWSQLGAVMTAFGHSDAASTFYRQALLQNPENTDFWISLAQALKASELGSRAQSMLLISNNLSSIFPLSSWGLKQIEKADQ